MHMYCGSGTGVNADVAVRYTVLAWVPSHSWHTVCEMRVGLVKVMKTIG